jgi:hypothetical protein
MAGTSQETTPLSHLFTVPSLGAMQPHSATKNTPSLGSVHLPLRIISRNSYSNGAFLDSVLEKPKSRENHGDAVGQTAFS